MNNSTCRYFPLVLTPIVYFLKLPCHWAPFCQYYKQLLSRFSFLGLFLPNHLSFSASCPLFIQLSFFSSGLKPPSNSSVYFLLGTLCPKQNSMLITHMFTLSACRPTNLYNYKKSAVVIICTFLLYFLQGVKDFYNTVLRLFWHN